METNFFQLNSLEETLKECILSIDAINYSIRQNNDIEHIKHLAVLAKFENEKLLELNNFKEAEKWANYAITLHFFLLKNAPEIDWYPDILLIEMRTIQNFQDLANVKKIETLIDDFIQRLPYDLNTSFKKIATWKALDISDILQLRRIKNSLRVFNVFLDEDYLHYLENGEILLGWLKIRSQLP